MTLKLIEKGTLMYLISLLGGIQKNNGMNLNRRNFIQTVQKTVVKRGFIASQFLSFWHFLVVLAFLYISEQSNAQCLAIGGSSGTVQNTMLMDIDFSIAISPTCSIVNWGSFTGVCGINLPGIDVPYSGNTDGSTSTITYSFSVPITSIDILIGHAGVNERIARETFVFTTNSLVPTLSVNSGACAAWTIVGNQSTSPAIAGGLNSIHTVSSSCAFTSLTITTNSTGMGPAANGGSTFAICNESLISVNQSTTTTSLGNDTTICQGESITLDATTVNATYQWQDQSTAPTFNVTQEGSYWVKVTDACGSTSISSSDTIHVDYNPIPTISLGNDTTLCQGESITLDATTPTTPTTTNYLWQDSSTNSTFNVTQQGDYWVQVIHTCGNITDTIHVNYNSIPNINLGNDTIICQGASITLDATPSTPTTTTTYLWQDNSTDSIFNVTQQGSYWVQVTDACGSITDTIHLNYNSIPIINLGNDTAICQGESITLDATTVNATYQWHDNSTAPTFIVNQQGDYWVKVTDICGSTSRYDTIHVDYNPIPTINLGNDTTICQGASITLDATTPNTTYNWQDHSTDSTFTVTQQGSYWVSVIDSNSCLSTDTLLFSLYNVVNVDLGADVVFCLGEEVVLDAGNNYISYDWSDGSITQTLVSSQEMQYWVSVIDSNSCLSSDTVHLFVELECELPEIEGNKNVFVSNSFTPNTDGLNDFFNIKFEGVKDLNLQVFNRWGNLLFETRNKYANWDGTYKGLKVSSGTYVYVLSVVFYDDTKMNQKGHINVFY